MSNFGLLDVVDAAVFGPDVVEVDALQDAIDGSLPPSAVRKDGREGGLVGLLLCNPHPHYGHVDGPKMTRF